MLPRTVLVRGSCFYVFISGGELQEFIAGIHFRNSRGVPPWERKSFLGWNPPRAGTLNFGGGSTLKREKHLRVEGRLRQNTSKSKKSFLGWNTPEGETQKSKRCSTLKREKHLRVEGRLRQNTSKSKKSISGWNAS